MYQLSFKLPIYKASVFLQSKPHINCKSSLSLFQDQHGINLKLLYFRKIADKP